MISAITTPTYTPQRNSCMCVPRYINRMFIEALLIVAEYWEQPK